MGAAVTTAVDAAAENIAAAKAHAAGAGLSIDYRAGELSAQGLGQFDLVTSMEVIEHVTDPAAFVAELTAHLKPEGLMILSTPNRTAASKLFLVEAAERLGQVPRGTHNWDQFLTPEELTALLSDAGLEAVESEGIGFSPLKGLHLSANKALNYILAARFA
jgi:2-polyprenyl-6-hydroxyphenyl methylase/3-demethylubiquinone-9 3-methyltransferase